jgi:hypothetical protein
MIMHCIFKFVSDDPQKSVETFLLTAAVCLNLDFIFYCFVTQGRFDRLLGCCSNGEAQYQLQREGVKLKSEVTLDFLCYS